MKSLFALLTLGFLGYFSYLSFFGKEIVLPKYSSYLSCGGTATDHEVKLKGEVYFVKSALPENEDEKKTLFLESIQYQQMYTFTNLGLMNSFFIKSSNLGNRPQVKILGIEEGEYPFEAVFEPAQEIYFFSPLRQAYLSQILPEGRIDKGEPAVRVLYEYKNTLNLCLKSSDISLMDQIDFVTPKDPYFAYFAFPPEERIVMRHREMKKKAVVNPCMDVNSIVAGKVNPFALWYHWLPKAKGSDENKKQFDCEKIYNEDVISKTKVELKERAPLESNFFNFEEFDALKRPIRLSIAFGAYNNESFQPFDKNEVERYIKKFSSNLSVREANQSLPINEAKYDSKLSSLLLLTWSLTKHVSIHSIESDINAYDMKFTLRGKLNLSKKDIEVQFFLSKNKPGAEGAQAFDQFFSEAIVNDDIVVYDGHSSYGGVFNSALTKARELQAKEPKNNLKYQLVALYSCNSNFYFHPDYFPKGEYQRDFISTGGGYLDLTNKATLALIASVDSYLYNESYVPFGLWSKQFKTNNFLILSNH